MATTVTHPADVPGLDTLSPADAAFIHSILDWTPTPAFFAALARELAWEERELAMTVAGVDAVLEASQPQDYFR